MVPSLSLLSCESSVSVKKTLIEKKNKNKKNTQSFMVHNRVIIAESFFFFLPMCKLSALAVILHLFQSYRSTMLRWLAWLNKNWLLWSDFFCNLLILIKLYKIPYLNLDKALLFPRNQAICLKNWKLWWTPTATEFNIFCKILHTFPT